MDYKCEGSDGDEALERESQDWVCRAPRRARSLAATLERADGSQIRALISNLAYDGCHLWSEGELEKGELLELHAPGMGIISAQVRWAIRDSAGLKFITGNSAVDERRARLGV